ncbi:hypothetical protein VTK73DRAFT_4286 [Phialemonium thermophilum]|uniref:Uncharacterized protein n=1 Tax=Phialemonium thermophilum TaxID=223376 RepID=A0ABR3VA23_9PEZI
MRGARPPDNIYICILKNKKIKIKKERKEERREVKNACSKRECLLAENGQTKSRYSSTVWSGSDEMELAPVKARRKALNLGGRAMIAMR